MGQNSTRVDIAEMTAVAGELAGLARRAAGLRELMGSAVAVRAAGADEVSVTVADSAGAAGRAFIDVVGSGADRLQELSAAVRAAGGRYTDADARADGEIV